MIISLLESPLSKTFATADESVYRWGMERKAVEELAKLDIVFIKDFSVETGQMTHYNQPCIDRDLLESRF